MNKDKLIALGHKKDVYSHSVQNKFINKMPYKSGFSDLPKMVYQKAAIWDLPVREYLSKYRHFKSSKKNLLRKLYRESDGTICLSGIVTNYHLEFNYKLKKMALFILILNVVGKKNQYEHTYVANHMWISPDLASQNKINWSAVGVGDVIEVNGYPHYYYGKLGNHYCYKTSLSNAYIMDSGYPVFENGRYQYSTFPYRHGMKCIYDPTDNSHIKLGNEIRPADKEKIKRDGFKFANAFKLQIYNYIRKGIHLTDEQLIFNNKTARLVWAKHNKYPNCSVVLTNTKKVKQNLSEEQFMVFDKIRHSDMAEKIMDNQYKFATQLNEQVESKIAQDKMIGRLNQINSVYHSYIASDDMPSDEVPFYY